MVAICEKSEKPVGQKNLIMKLFLASVVTAFALVLSAKADDATAKITDVHICCHSCVKGIDTAVATVPGVKDTVDQDAGTITLTGADKASLQKATDALTAAGYFGKSSDVTLDSATGAKNEKVQSMTVTGLHLCCGKCVKAVDKTVKSVAGVTGDDATKNAKSFTVTGDFNAQDVMAALQKEGLTGKVSN
jgi:mercuric ion binding protein